MARIFSQGLRNALLATSLLVTTFGNTATAGFPPGPVCGNTCGSDDRFGTQISWVENASEARQEAVNSNKLLMVMQISGDFSKPTFT